MSPLKRCPRCRKHKPLGDFNRSARASDGRQGYCRNCKAAHQRVDPNRNRHRQRWEEKNPEAKRRYYLAWFTRLRDEVHVAYGGRCGCCGEERREFLTIDHVGGRDEEHQTMCTASVMVRAKREGFPDCYRLLCWNCNCSRGVLGYCPHEREREVEAVA